ncbi:hypothetical protein [Nocardia sp. NPDC058666]|uniref:TPR repeat region-containing protein n=1 Tax=Nocardia sp. NPDC058666 TaxID=3346587 RepID=UPI00364F99BD
MSMGLSQMRTYNPEATTSAVARGVEALVADFRKNMADVYTKVDATHDDWKGDAAKAANERALGERLSGNKLATELEDIATAYKVHGAAMDGYCKAAVAAADGYIIVGMNVADDGTVTAPAGATGIKNPAMAGGVIKMSPEQLATYAVEATSRVKGLINQFITEDLTLAQKAGQELLDLVQKANGEFGLGPQKSDRYGNSGVDDGKALAEALRTNDTARIDEILASMPDNSLPQADLAALAAGKDIAVPAELRDYYKNLYQDLGKDGLLSLNSYLTEQSQPGSATLPAAVQAQSNIANGLMMVSNERIGTGFDNTGKLISPGDYNQLPASLRNGVSGRLADVDLGKVAPQGPYEFQKRLQEKIGMADLMSHADDGMPPGTTLGTELGRQGADLADYVDGKATVINQWSAQHWQDAMPDGTIGANGVFGEPSKESLESAAQKYLEVGTSNPEAAYQLLTGKNSHTGEPLPADLSFGANADHNPTGNYDPSKLVTTAIRHEWPDDGKAAAGMVDWIGEHTHDQSKLGDLSREAYAGLPNILSPHDDAGVLVTEGKGDEKKSVFAINAESFLKNPELATGLSKTLAPNIDSIQGNLNVPDMTPGSGRISTADAERMLFLAAESQEGVMYLETARQTYDLGVLSRLEAGGYADPAKALTIMGGIDARMDSAISNAALFRDVNDKIEGYSHRQEIYDSKQKAAEFASMLVGGVTDGPIEKMPGGAIVHGIVGEMRDKGMESVIEKWNPKPEEESSQFPRPQDLKANAYAYYDEKVALHNLSTDARDKLSTAYNGLAVDTIIDSPDALNQFLAGGAAQVTGGNGGGK